MTGVALLSVLMAIAAPEPTACQVADVAMARAAHLGAYALSWREAEELAEVVITEARRHNVRPAIILAIIEVESAYDPRTVSSAKCVGLMQLNPKTARALAPRLGLHRYRLRDITASVRLGTAYAREMYDTFGRWDYAFSSYNRGPGLFERQRRPVGKYAQSVMKKTPIIEELLRAATEPCHFYCNADESGLFVEAWQRHSSCRVPPRPTSGPWTSTTATTSPAAGCRPSTGAGATVTPWWPSLAHEAT